MEFNAYSFHLSHDLDFRHPDLYKGPFLPHLGSPTIAINMPRLATNSIHGGNDSHRVLDVIPPINISTHLQVPSKSGQSQAVGSR